MTTEAVRHNMEHLLQQLKQEREALDRRIQRTEDFLESSRKLEGIKKKRTTRCN